MEKQRKIHDLVAKVEEVGRRQKAMVEVEGRQKRAAVEEGAVLLPKAMAEVEEVQTL